MEKKEKNEDLEQLQIDDNHAMSKDVLDTFNYFMDYYRDIYRKTDEETKIVDKNKREILEKNDTILMKKIFSKYQTDIEELLSSDKIKETFINQEVKTKEEVKKALALHFYTKAWLSIFLNHGEEEISTKIQDAINEKKRYIQNEENVSYNNDNNDSKSSSLTLKENNNEQINARENNVEIYIREIYENKQSEHTDAEYCQNIINTFVKDGTELTEFDVSRFRKYNKDNQLLQHKSAFFWLNEQERRNNALLDFIINNDAGDNLDTLNQRLRNIRGGKCSWCCGDW